MKRKLFIIPAIAAAMLSMTALPSYAEDIPVPTTPQIHVDPYCGIRLDKKPDKTYYTIGDKLDLSGLTVSVLYGRAGYISDPSEAEGLETVIEKTDPTKDKKTFTVTTDFDNTKAGTYTVTVALTDEAQSKWFYAEPQTFTVTVKADESRWIPDSYDNAMEFYNIFGKTRIVGNKVYIVRTISSADGVENKMTFTDGEKAVEPKNLKTATYSYELKQPEPDDDGPVMMPMEPYSAPTFHVIEFELGKNEKIFADLTSTNASGKVTADQTFSFESDEKGTVKETDIYAILPDSEPEYKTFVNNYGNFARIDNTIFFCGTVSGSTGATMKFDSSGTGEFTAIKQSCAPAQVIFQPISGGGSYTVIACTPSKSGVVCGKWFAGREWDPDGEDYSSITKWYSIDESLKLTEITEEQFNAGGILDGANVEANGDVNGDGEFGVADLVSLNGWLMGDKSVTAKNPMAADLCRDGKIDAFDLCLMRKALVGDIATEPDPSKPRLVTFDDLAEMSRGKHSLTLDMLEPYTGSKSNSQYSVACYEIDMGDSAGKYTYRMELYPSDHENGYMPAIIRTDPSVSHGSGEDHIDLFEVDGEIGLGPALFDAPDNNELNRKNAMKVANYAKELKDLGILRVGTTMYLRDFTAEGITNVRYESHFLSFKYVNANTVKVVFNRGNQYQEWGYYITDGSVEYELGNNTTLDRDSHVAGMELLERHGNVYFFQGHIALG